MPRKQKKILVPKTVSLTVECTFDGKISGIKTRSGKTRAFVKKGVKMPKGLSLEQQFQWRKKIAHGSEYFIKPLSQRAKNIRGILEKNGIMVEKAIQDLKNGKFLFKKTGNSLDSIKGMKLFFKNREKNIENIAKAVRKMHSLGITHNHLHLGNIAITNNGKVVLLDFGRARLSKKTIKGGFGVLQDLCQAAESLAQIEIRLLKLNKKQQQKRKKEILWLFLDNYSKQATRMMEKNAKQQLQKQKK